MIEEIFVELENLAGRLRDLEHLDEAVFLDRLVEDLRKFLEGEEIEVFV